MFNLLRPQSSSWIYVGGLLCACRVINTRWGSGHSHWCLVMVMLLIKAQIGLGLWELSRKGEPTQGPAIGIIASCQRVVRCHCVTLRGDVGGGLVLNKSCLSGVVRWGSPACQPVGIDWKWAWTDPSEQRSQWNVSIFMFWCKLIAESSSLGSEAPFPLEMTHHWLMMPSPKQGLFLLSVY